MVTCLIQQRLSRRTVLKIGEESTNRRELSSSSKNQTASWWVFYAVYSCCLFVTVFNSFPSWISYLISSLEITSGYSSAMSSVGSRLTLAIAISELVLISIPLTLIAKKGRLGFSLALLFVLFLDFKHGFVRQDIFHVITFAWSTLIVTTLCITQIKSIRVQKLSYLLDFYILIVAFIFWKPLGISIHHTFSPQIVMRNFSYLLNLNDLKSSLIASIATNLALEKLPNKVTSFVGNQKIDLIPWEISLVPANNLNWKPRPIFQSYSAYTTSLDNTNFRSLSTEPREYIFYSFSSIDGRHPFFDQPATFFYVFCNYKPCSQVPDFINL